MSSNNSSSYALTTQYIEKFVKENRYSATSGSFFSRCVDGRYKSSIDLPPLATPGADLGYLMTLLAANETYRLGLSFEECRDLILDVVGGENAFHFHSDTHAHEVGRGCGHFREAISDPASYGLTQQIIEKTRSFLTNVLTKDTVCTILEGEHKEGAVVVVKSEKWSIFSQDKKGTQVFVYHKTFDERRRKQIADAVHKKLLTVSFNTIFTQLSTVAQIQRNETLKRLAPNLPVYHVRIGEEGEVQLSRMS